MCLELGKISTKPVEGVLYFVGRGHYIYILHKDGMKNCDIINKYGFYTFFHVER